MSSLLILRLSIFMGVCACAYAWTKGGRAERYAALIILANFAIGAVGHEIFGRFEGLIFRLTNDALAAFALMALTVIFASPWLGLAMLFYAGQFTLHATYFVMGRSGTDHLHAVINNIQFAGILLCLVAGTTVTWLRRLRAERAVTPGV